MRIFNVGQSRFDEVGHLEGAGPMIFEIGAERRFNWHDYAASTMWSMGFSGDDLILGWVTGADFRAKFMLTALKFASRYG
jgi:hypothetical protein